MNLFTVNLIVKIYVILIGLVFGSFLNVLIYRIPLKISISKGSSFCTSCKHKLIWIDLFPLFSYIFLGGKCRYCKSKISPRYPAIEALNAICYYLIYLEYVVNRKSNISLESGIVLTILYAIVCSCLIVLAMIDYDYQIIPDRFQIIIGVCAVASAFFPSNLGLGERIAGLFLISVPFLIISIITGGMGEGDIKLFAVCGFLLGWKQILLSMLISSVIAAIYGLILMITKKANRKSEIPFGPFIALAVIVCLITGNEIIDFYLNLFPYI